MLSLVPNTPAQPKWCVRPTRCWMLPSTVRGLSRLVTNASTTTEPRLFHTRTLSPASMPFSAASSSEISTNWAGIASTSAGQARDWPPVCQCSVTE